MNEGKTAKAEPKEQKAENKPEAAKGHSYPLFLYHSEHAPEGKLCKTADHHKGEGWVDSPAKFSSKVPAKA